MVATSRPKSDIALMEKMISKRIKTNKRVIAYNTIVADNYRLVSYIVEDVQEYKNVGYARFKISRNGNYELINVIDADKVTKKAHDITVYEFSQLKAGDFSINKNLFVISNNPELSKIERIMDNGEIQAKEIITNPSISFWGDLDEDTKAKYNFYNKDGKIIK